MYDVTFGITTFDRPQLLANLIRSILQKYPAAKIVVADNGKERGILPDSVRRIELPFDCGLSRARNALIDNLETKYLLILEDDFLFTDETNIEPLVDVLDHDGEVGVVGGALRSIYGRVAAYALDLEEFRDTLYVREAVHRQKFTPQGTSYRLCDMVWNFALFRKEMLLEHRWNDRLKVGEHCPYYHQVKRAKRWRVAACTMARIYHVPEQRSRTYLQYRRRAQDLFQSYLEEQGIKHYHRVLPYHFEDTESKPNVIVMGVGHSGTTVLTRMLQGLGWNVGDADADYAESRSIRELNISVMQTGTLSAQRARKALEQLATPWAIKDPRFVSTLHHWLPYFLSLDEKPVLLRLRRDRNAMLASYHRRNAPGDVALRIEQQILLADKQFARWPWAKFNLEYEAIGQAVAAFDLQRFQQSQAPLNRHTAINTEIGSTARTQGFTDSMLSALRSDSQLANLAVAQDSMLALVQDGSTQPFMDGSLMDCDAGRLLHRTRLEADSH